MIWLAGALCAATQSPWLGGFSPLFHRHEETRRNNFGQPSDGRHGYRVLCDSQNKTREYSTDKRRKRQQRKGTHHRNAPPQRWMGTATPPKGCVVFILAPLPPVPSSSPETHCVTQSGHLLKNFVVLDMSGHLHIGEKTVGSPRRGGRRSSSVIVSDLSVGRYRTTQR